MGKKRNRKIKISKESKKQISTSFLRIYAIILILFISIIAYWYVFDEKLDLNGDNTAYYLLGKSISSGSGFTSIWNVGQAPHNHYPVGYPLIIALLMIISESVIFIKIINFLLFLATLIILYRLTEHLFHNLKITFLAVLFVAINANLLRFSTIMMSEIAYLFFSVLVLYALIKIDFSENPFKQKMVYILIISMVLAYLVRTIGVAVIFGVLVYLVIFRYWKYVIVILGGTILLILPWSIRNASLGHSSYLNQLMMVNPYRQELGTAGLLEIMERIFNNLIRYISQEIPVAGLPFLQSIVQTNGIYGWIAGVLLIALAVYGLYRMQKYKTIILPYLVGIFGILLLWPDVWFGIRFIIPILPLIIILAVYGLFDLAEQLHEQLTWSRNLVIVIIIVLLFFSVGALKNEHSKAEAPYPPAYKNYFNIATWIKKNTDQDAVICCRKTSVFNFFSQRLTTKYKYTNDSKDLLETLEKQNVDYVVVEQLGYGSTPRYLIPAIQKNQHRFQQILHLKNPDTYLLKLKKNE